MTIKELKSEIQKSLDNVPESILQDVLAFLKQAENQPADQVKLTKNLRDILTEDKKLLERLAKCVDYSIFINKYIFVDIINNQQKLKNCDLDVDFSIAPL